MHLYCPGARTLSNRERRMETILLAREVAILEMSFGLFSSVKVWSNGTDSTMKT